MSIPIIDIHSGDTMSSMVDKINYNFSLLSLKGGGPSGIQGIQGVRGPVGPLGPIGPTGLNGSMIYNANPANIDLNDPDSPYNVNDVFIYNGIISNVAYNITDQQYEFHTICDLHDFVESPFSLTGNPNAIMPYVDYENYPFILGVGNTDIGTISSIVNEDPSNMSALNIKSGNFQSYIKFFDNTTNLIGSIKYQSSKLNIIGESEDGVALVGPGTPSQFVNVKMDGIYVSDFTGAQNQCNYILSRDLNGKLNTDYLSTDTLWCTDTDTFGSSTFNSIFPYVGTGSLKSSIGSRTYRLDRICLNEDSQCIFTCNDNVSSSAIQFVSDLSNTNVLGLSKYGVAIGGLKQSQGNNSIYRDFNNEVFALKLNTPASTGVQIKYGTMFTLTSNTNNDNTESVVSDDTYMIYNNGSYSGTGQTTNSTYRGVIYLANGSDSNHFKMEHFSNLIVADRKTEAGTNKNPNDVLHIHGADSNANAGSDIVLTGGNNLGGSNNVAAVGGDVYISGGTAFGTYNNELYTDMKRYGDVIIGINPLHHKGCLNNTGYSSTMHDTNNSSTNPVGASFFDIRNVAIHGNRIVIDSNANYRKITQGYTKNDGSLLTSGTMTPDTQPDADMSPYVTSPENTSLQISAVNTIKHEEPVVIDRQDICSHQFMSGSMRRIIRFSQENGTISKLSIDPDSFKKQSLSNAPNSVYFISEQVWQKVGNIVHVNAFGRWVASKPNTTDLYYITDHFFTKDDPNKEIDVSGFENNTILINWLLNSIPGPGSSTIYVYKNRSNIMNQWPMTAFALPVVVENMCSTYCYGTGNIFTEDNCYQRITSEQKSYNPTDSVIQSTPIMVGAYYHPHQSELNTNSTIGSNMGDNTELHYTNNRVRTARNKNSTATNLAPYDFVSTTINADDVFRNPTSSTSSGYWNESNFKQTEIMNMQNWCYIYPEMLTDYGNLTSGISRKSKRVRPCIGMYTWITLDYSYSVMDGFNKEVTPIINRSTSMTPNNPYNPSYNNPW